LRLPFRHIGAAIAQKLSMESCGRQNEFAATYFSIFDAAQAFFPVQVSPRIFGSFSRKSGTSARKSRRYFLRATKIVMQEFKRQTTRLSAQTALDCSQVICAAALKRIATTSTFALFAGVFLALGAILLNGCAGWSGQRKALDTLYDSYERNRITYYEGLIKPNEQPKAGSLETGVDSSDHLPTPRQS
jgi:hypothetical protein